MILTAIISAIGCFTIASGNPGAFKMEYYRGPQSNAVLAVYYKGNFTMPKCYGALINWNVAMVPCSCVIVPPQPNTLATWWDQTHHRRVTPDQPSNYKANIMTYEYHYEREKTKFSVEVVDIKLSPRCDTSFQYNVARIKLKGPIQGSKLAWIAHPNENKMKTLLSRAVTSIAVRGYCFIMQWDRGETNINTVTRKTINQTLERIPVTMMVFDTCRRVVCPTDAILPVGMQAPKFDKRICRNEITGSRRCLEPEQGEVICDVTPGTPVFCDVGRLVGLSGFIHSEGMWCPQSNYNRAIMEGIDLALPLIKNDMRLINVMDKKFI